MKNSIMLIHDGSWPEAFLNISVFLQNIGIFVYDNHSFHSVQSEALNKIRTVIVLIPDDEALKKFCKLDISRATGVILSEGVRDKIDNVKQITKKLQSEVICSSNITEITRFVSTKFAAGDKGFFETLTKLHNIFMQNRLIQAYYCAQCMDLPLDEWKSVIRRIHKAVSEFNRIRSSSHSEYILFATAMGMKRANDLCVKIFDLTQTRWSVLTEEQVLLFDEKRILSGFGAAYRCNSDLKLACIFYNDISQHKFPSFQHAKLVLEKCMQETEFYYAYYKYGILLKTVKKSEAFLSFKKAIFINPYCYRSRYLLGLMYEKLEDYENAREHYQKIIEILCRSEMLHPIEFEYLYKAFYRMGIVFSEVEDYETALDYCKKADDLWDTLQQNAFLQQFFTGLIQNPEGCVKGRIHKNVLDGMIVELQRRIEISKKDDPSLNLLRSSTKREKMD